MRSIGVMQIRGGTSVGIFIDKSDLLNLVGGKRGDWEELFRRIIGSPCKYARQINGLGRGTSSTSKICVLDYSHEKVQFEFFQVGVVDEIVDSNGTCGNLLSAVPLYAHFKNWTKDEQVRIFDVNTRKEIVTTMKEDGYAISGVSGLGRRVECEYLNVGGTKTGTLLPTGSKTDDLDGLQATCIDGPNPGVFINHSDITDKDSLSSEVLNRLERIRILGTIKMGIAKDEVDARRFQAIPKISLLKPEEGGIRALTLSMQQPHRAIPITIALSLAIAMRSPATIAHRLARGNRIFHPSGFVDVDANLEKMTATVSRSARLLMAGEAFIS